MKLQHDTFDHLGFHILASQSSQRGNLSIEVRTLSYGIELITVNRGPQSVQAVNGYLCLLSESLNTSSRQLSHVAMSGGMTDDPEKFLELSSILKSLNSIMPLLSNHSISSEFISDIGGLFSFKLFINSLILFSDLQ